MEVVSMSASVAVVMGSRSDYPVVQNAVTLLESFGIAVEMRVLSAHRTPEEAAAFARGARGRGVGVIIAAAGKAAHLPGVLAAYTTLPVIGLPVKTSLMGGMDSLLSIVQMPAGIPVATVGVDASQNAALLAVEMLAITDGELADRLADYRKSMADKVLADDANIRKGE
ncbi:MAG: 5-(carboxyamino)imidazole ribonucleotide mutase [Clostridiales bacterium]|nr:5-(carboxyamino)imidazole ribonucleotide mutase [Clostridiales bacterium]